jgi:Mrp family chromosome partitioning ATPase/capsular polysaccharide biosynthesis protein
MNETTDASAIFAPLWRRKWLILAVAILVALGSYFYYKREASVYSTSTQIYLANGAEEQTQASSTGKGHEGKKAGGVGAGTSATLINSSIIKEAVRDQLRKEKKTPEVRAALKGKAKAKAVEKSQFITVSAEARNPKGTALLANTTAQEFVKRTNAHFRREVETSISLARRQLRRIEVGAAAHASAKGKSGSKGASATSTLQAATLSSKINQLEGNLAINEVAQIDPATKKSSKLLKPKPKSNAIFGFAIGLLLAALAAYLLGRLDRRIRSLSAIEEIFETQILTALKAVRRPIGSKDGHPAPAKALREALWRLQTTLQVGPAQEHERVRPPRVILCVSADAGDGKSTTVAALALTLSAAGERVAVIEADFRRPVQSRLLGVSGPQGLADVLTGRLTLEEAIQGVSLVRPEAGVASAQAPAGGTATLVESAGAISVLRGATEVANPPALLSRPEMAELPRSLADDFDYVLIDAPPPLQVSDVMPLLGAVDGILIVARIGHTRETSAQRLMQLLKRTPSAPVLGVVANAVSQKDIKKYGLYSAEYKRGWRQKLLGQ